MSKQQQHQVISFAEAESIARKACENDASIQVLDYALEAYSEDTLGFLGSHQKLVITVQLDHGKTAKKLDFFVKAVPRESREQTDYVKRSKVFEHESAFFRSVMPHLLEATSIGEIEPWAPVCYLAKDDAIVLEDVRTKGYVMSDVKLLEGESLMSVARTMARLHAASILAEKKLGKRFDEYCPEACSEQLFVDIPQIRQWSEFLYSDEIEKVAARCKRSDVEKVKQAVHKAYGYATTYESEYKVVNHADCWCNNVMQDCTRPTPKTYLIDYQMVRYFSGMLDLAVMMYLTTRRGQRKQAERQVLEAYWQEVCLTLEKCDPTVEKPRFKLLLDEYEDARLPALLTAVSYMPVILIKPDVFKEYDPETLFKKFVFRRDNECLLEMMDRDSEYAERIEETVMEFLDRVEQIKYV